MTDFVEYVVSELKSKRLTRDDALSLVRQFYLRSPNSGKSAVLHPLLHANTSDLSRQRYTSTFTGQELFLADHLVEVPGGNRHSVLPGVAYLEMARAAVERALPDSGAPRGLELRDVVWSRPLVVRAPTEVSICLSTDESEQIAYEISSSTAEGDAIVHCQGRAIFTSDVAGTKLDFEELKSQMRGSRLEGESLYALCGRMGLHYGTAHRGVESLVRGERQLLARLQLPTPCIGRAAEYVLHPSILDAALQACLVIESEQGYDRPWLPFALDCLRIAGPCRQAMWVWGRYSANGAGNAAVRKLDIDLCDDHGDVCVQMRGFTARELNAELVVHSAREPAGELLREPEPGIVQAVPVWEPKPPQRDRPTSVSPHLLLLGLDPIGGGDFEQFLRPTTESLPERCSAYALRCFEHVQQILRSKPSGKVLLQWVTDGSWELSALSGLLNTVSLENPQLACQLIEMHDAPITSNELVRRLEECSADERVIRYTKTGREVRRWHVTPGATLSPLPSWREDGVYLITGGRGGLGRIFAQEILAQTQRARVILTGRSALDERHSQELQGTRIEYRLMDVTDREQVREQVAAIRSDYGALHGILHCAGVIADNFIVKKTAAEFDTVLRPKVHGTVYLDEASRELPLDFLALFSSVAGALGNVGQADYATANAFMDAYARHRNELVAKGERYGRTISINWPLWAAGGMKVDEASRAQLEELTGMHAMRTVTGLHAFHESLHSGASQWLVMEGEIEKLQRTLEAGQPVPNPDAAASTAAGTEPPAEGLLERTQDYLRRQLASVLKLPSNQLDPHASLGTYGIDSILAVSLTGQLEKSFGPLSKTLFFEYQSIAELAAHFVETHSQQLTRLFAPTRTEEKTPELPTRRFVSRRQNVVSQHRPVPARDDSPIAIVGLSGRYPQSPGLEEYWQNLRDGQDCIIEIPKDRWDWREYFSADRTLEGVHLSKWGGFISGVDEFDPLFFGISPVEAELIDPQERLFLQHVWMALEDAGCTRSSLQRAHQENQAGQVGVYVGVMYGEYQLLGAEATLRGKRMGIPVSYASIANRVSYSLNLHGPSMALDTMCSSSLTAIHLACNDLKRGVTRVGIAGGVNVTIHSNKYLILSAGQYISGDGHCQSFGEGGDGYIPGEGVGVVILKRLSDALEDGNHIYGVIKGSALNHGGKTSGYSVPNPQAQAAVIRRAWAECAVEPRHISYMEAHGTGTRLGDPIEIAALTQAFRDSTQENQFCLLGSAKSNIGHCESAAGIAGLTKVLLQMKHRMVVPSLHSAVLNPHIDFERTPFIVNQTLQPWQQPRIAGRTVPRIAGISSFGAGGSNAHLIVEEYEQPATAEVHRASVRSQVLIPLSAKTTEQLLQKARDLLAFIQRHRQQIDLPSMAYTLQVGREAMECRLGFLVSTTGQLVERLQAYLEGEQDIEDSWRGQVRDNKEALALFSTDKDLQKTVAQWLAAGKLSKLLELWAKGLDVDWSQLAVEGQPRLMSLPVYPFARERYWVSLPAQGAPGGKSTVTETLHPLLHTNTSDFHQQSYRSILTGEEPFLTDHQVRLDGERRKVLPGVAYLEMAREAIERAQPGGPESRHLELRQVVWVQPLAVLSATAVDIALWVSEEQQIEFEVCTDDLIHCQGRAAFEPEQSPPPLDLEQLRKQMTRATLSSDSIYAAYARMGVDYGPAHRAIASMQLGEQQLLARVGLPAITQASLSQYVLHPSLMDGALQAAIGLLDLSDDAVSQPRLPFALESLRVFSACSQEMLAWVRYSPGSRLQDTVIKLDIDLCDVHGRVCVQMRGFSSRALEKQGRENATPSATTGALTFAPVWQARPIEEAVPVSQLEYAERHVILCEMPDIDVRQLEGLLQPLDLCLELQARPQKTLPERYTDHALACFEKVRILLEGKPQRRVLVQVVVPDAEERATFGGLAGLLRTASQENPQIAGQLILTPPQTSTQALAEQLREEARSNDTFIRYEQGCRHVLRWLETPLGSGSAPPSFRSKGVYLITGGLGGLGLLFAREILQHTPEAVVILTGRSALTPQRQALLSTLTTQPGQRVEYRTLDLLDIEQVRQLIDTLKTEHHRLDGILHSAGMIADNFILKKSPAEFRRVLAPKVTGAFNLDQATAQTDLDFFVLFSSVAAAMGNAGQADYAAANGFMDHFAGYRNQLAAAGHRQGRTLSINWPLWLDGGMQIDPALRKLLQQATGMHPLTTDVGMQAFYRGLESKYTQIMVLEGDVEQLRRVVAGERPSHETPAQEQPLTAAKADGTRSAEANDLVELTQNYLARQFATLLKLPAHKIDPQAALENYGIDSVLAMKLTNALEKTFGSLSKTLFFEHQTLAALARYLLTAYPQVVRAQVGSEHEPRSNALEVTSAAGVQDATTRRPPSRRKHRFVDAVRPAQREVAIIGVAGRYPQAEDLQAFWENLRSGRDCISEIPPDRWDHTRYFDADHTSAGKTYSKWGGFIQDVDKFDPLFFNISPKEAQIIDPQERLFLQTAWHTLEDAGYSKESLSGKRVGVFVGAMWSHYELFGSNSLVTQFPLVPTSSHASIANRVSYFLNFQGPSLALDTMCSSSLTALHLASEAIRRGEIEAALAGGVNVSIHPQKYLSLAQGKFMSSDGRCRAFGEGGDGYVPGEGVGAVFLKPLDQALRDGDHVYAVIKSSAINHGGKTNGYTVPNPNLQGDLILEALEKAGVDPKTLGYIETHGTGTSLGDPIEITGLLKAFDGPTTRRKVCPIGSVKSNIGHLEAAAGIAALTKVLLQLRHGQLVPSLHAQPPNPHIDFETSPFYVQTHLEDWQRPADYPRRVAVSSFGAGGSNAHVILEEEPELKTRSEPAQPVVFVLSARDQQALIRYAQKFVIFLGQARSEPLIDIAYTSQVGRTALQARVAVLASNVDELRDRIEQWVESQNHGLPAPEGVFEGNTQNASNNVGHLVQGPAGKAFLRELLANQDLPKVALLWVLGADIDWSLAYPGADPRRVSLPTYPFAKERYWIDTESSTPRTAAVTPTPLTQPDADVRQVCYAPRWTAAPLRESADPFAGSILLLDEDEEIFQALRARLGEGRVVLARPGDDITRLLETLNASGEPAPQGVLHHCRRSGDLEHDSQVAKQLDHGLYALLHACKAFMQQKQPTLKIVSFFHTQPRSADPLSTALGGFSRTLTLENPGYLAKVIEIQGAQETSAEVPLLLNELADAQWATSEIRYHGDERYVLEYATHISTAAPTSTATSRLRPAGLPELPLRERGVYLITGGGGGLGLILAHYLARDFRAKLVLVGRSAPDSGLAKKIETLEASGAEVLYLRADTADLAQMQSVLQQAKARFGHLHGVIHGAGIHRDAFILKKTQPEMAAVLNAKVHGTLVLDRVTAAETLDLFVLFASLAGALGNPGQCDYAYGNRFLDAFAESRETLRSLGQRSGRTVSIDWPFWQEGGMRLPRKEEERLAQSAGLHPLPTAAGLACLQDILRSDLQRALVLYGEPDRIEARLTQRVLNPAKPRADVLKRADAAGLLAKTEAYLKALVGEEIHLRPEQIDSRAPFASLGLESIVIGKCNARLERDLGPLPKTLLYEYESVGELARYLVKEAQESLLRLFDGAVSREAIAEETLVVEPSAPLATKPPKTDELEPIAIVGVHGRYPRSATLEEYWENLKAGRDLIELVPADRWDRDALYDPDPQAAAKGRIYCQWGGFVEDHDKFDARFFGVSAEEARSMDPQERVFLESVWSALEDAGYTRERLRACFPKGKGIDAGVFVGITTHSYNLLASDELAYGNHASPAALPWSIANRVSYFFDFKGPSLPVDTACSSSLVALHMACASLRNRECELAIAGGVNLYLHPSKYLSLCQRRMLAVGGRCRSYGAGDDGFVPSEGVGTLVLKRLSRALADNDRIYAVVRASAFDHSGRSNGYSAPNPNAQASLIARALDEARIHPESISYIEGHGTGTQLGDSLEIAALRQAFETRTTKKQFCALGSVKASIGHGESAAGIAGVTKVLLQMKHQELAPSLHSQTVNPNIAFDESPFRLQHALGPWEPAAREPRRALINSFGAGGVNACVVLEEYAQTDVQPTRTPEAPCVFTLSARTEERLRDYAQRLLRVLKNRAEIDLPALCYTLQTGREAMSERLAMVVADVPQLIQQLEDWTQGRSSADVHRGSVHSTRPSRGLAATNSLTELAMSWATGESVEWASLYAETRPRRIVLPTYPFARERHWISDARLPQRPAAHESVTTGLHPLVSCNASTLRDVSFSSSLADDAFYAVDHEVNDELVLPGAAFLEMACICGRIAGERRVHRITDVVWIQPLSFRSGSQSTRTFLKYIGPDVEYAITSLDEDGESRVHCEGRLHFSEPDAETGQCVSIDALKEQLTIRHDGAHFYREFTRYGLRYGPAFQTLHEVHVGGSRALAKLKLPKSLEAQFAEFVLHPALIDGALQTIAALMTRAEPGVPHVPFAVDEVEILRPLPPACYACAEPSDAGPESHPAVRKFNIQLLSERGETLIRIKNLHVRAYGKAPALSSSPSALSAH